MMTKIKIIMIAAAVLIVAAGVFMYFNLSMIVSDPGDAIPTATSTLVTTDITMADVAKHSTSADCWTVVRGNVYNLTAWIAKHPGGREAIIKLCGKDGTAKFVGKHEGQDGPEAALVSFKIGALAK